MIETFKPLKVDANLPADMLQRNLRLNCLGSLYFFTKHGLQRDKLTESYHLPMCRRLETEHIKDVIEHPRGHFKTTVHSEGWPMWRALPFTIQDEDCFSQLGYSDTFIRFMQVMHNPYIRILIVSETLRNAEKIGRNIKQHVESGYLYRGLFPETLPTKQDQWTAHSLLMGRPKTSDSKSIHGEGTFDFLGVGNALQSRHYNIIIQDDIVGMAAVEQPATMEMTIDYHQLLLGAFDNDDPSYECDELVVENRWSMNDLNSHIIEKEPWFRIETHSALGGCCQLHEADKPIFPELFNLTKLQQIKARLGNYKFSCQYLNKPVSSEDADFKEEYFNYFKLDKDDMNRFQLTFEGKNGFVRKPILARQLKIVIAADPNHSGNVGNGRSRHAIVCMGQDGEGPAANYYLLDYFAERCNYEKFYAKLFEMAKKFRVKEIGLETIAAQKYCAYALTLINRVSDWPLKIKELKGEVEGPDGILSRKKEWRIRAMLSPIFERGAFHIQRQQQDFISEATTFPRAKTWDILDALAYCPNMLDKVVDANTMRAWYSANQNHLQSINKPYSVSLIN